MSRSRSTEGRQSDRSGASRIDAAAALRPLRDVWRSAPLTPHASEHEAALLRILLFVVLAAAAAGLADRIVGAHPVALAATALLAAGGATAILLRILLRPQPSTARSLASVIGDQVALGVLAFLLGPAGPWMMPLLLMIAIDAGLRYDRTHGVVAGGVGAAGIGLVWLVHGETWTMHALLGGWLLAQVMLPLYGAWLGKRLEAVSHDYRKRARKMRQAALYDELTHLANRAQFRRTLERAVDQARGGAEEDGFAILYVDLDGFKAVNDTHGHHVGDVLLKTVAAALRRCVRGDSDVVARLGGDEFAIYLRGIRDVEIARRIAASIVTNVKAIGRVEDRPISVSCSVGVTLVQAPLAENEHLDRMLARADEAMYQAKRAGKNQFYLQWAS